MTDSDRILFAALLGVALAAALAFAVTVARDALRERRTRCTTCGHPRIAHDWRAQPGTTGPADRWTCRRLVETVETDPDGFRRTVGAHDCRCTLYRSRTYSGPDPKPVVFRPYPDGREEVAEWVRWGVDPALWPTPPADRSDRP